MSRREDNLDFYLRAVEEKFETFKQSLAQLISALSAEDSAKKKAAAEAASVAINNLLAIISRKDHPAWANQFRTDLEKFIEKYRVTGASGNLVNSIIGLHSQIHSKAQSFAAISMGDPLDFEAVFKQFYEQSRISELFELLIGYLQEIVNSGELDSLKAIETLNDLIATIRANMRGTYFQTVGVTRFATSLFRNYLRNLLKKIPGVGTLVKSIEDTLSELDVEMSEVHSQVARELSKFAGGEVELLGYEKTGSILEHSNNSTDS